jgi:hypothetical protein
MGERCNRTAEVRGSIPLSSTSPRDVRIGALSSPPVRQGGQAGLVTEAAIVLDREQAARLASVALGHVRREYPNKPGDVHAGPADARPHRMVHPVFYGSFDWHSSVHTHWMLARLLRRFPELPQAGAIRALFDEQFVAGKIEAECAAVAAPAASGFERPYGWAWLLKLAQELALCDEDRWSRELSPLTRIFSRRFCEFLPRATYPVRSGAHFNSAFGLRLAADYAAAAADGALAALLRATAWRWYGEDMDCPAWGEPGGDDFLSPALIEAECMRRLLPAEAFAPWLGRFLPRLAQGEPATLFRPATVSDRADGKTVHLDGLNLSRAWCWRALAPSLPPDARPAAEQAATRHLTAALPHVADEYAGAHWLASFAVLALDR